MTHSLQRQYGIAAKSLLGQDFDREEQLQEERVATCDGQYQLLPHPPDSAACNNLNVWKNKVVSLFTKHCIEVETVLGNEFRLARHYMDDMVLQVSPWHKKYRSI